MSKIVSYPFTLDQATLTNGAAIVAAGSGLPRRITGQIDYSQRVLALNPSGYWRLGEAAGQALDSTANARHLTLTGSWSRAQPGHGRGGSAWLSLKNINNLARCTAAAEYPEHRLVGGVPFAFCFQAHLLSFTGQIEILSTQTAGAGVYRGWTLWVTAT